MPTWHVARALWHQNGPYWAAEYTLAASGKGRFLTWGDGREGGLGMTFEDILDQALTMLQRRGRVTYGTLQRQFALDADALEDLKDALLYAHPQVADDQGRGLLWTGDVAPTPAVSQAAPPPAAPRTQPEAERRQLTVLFCDLADSTRLARQLDPEDLRVVVRAYQETAAAVIQRYDGHIAQYLGDGLLVYFGYPQAHEDDTQRAVRTGLELVAAMRTLNTQLVPEQGVRLAVRIGIHTGLVVVGEMGSGDRHEHLALGDTPNLAARLQSLAEPDTVVLSATTARLVQGYFVCQDRGVQTLKGLDTPVRVAQVVEESAAQSRLDVAAATGLTPLVGREAEVALLRERWAQVTDGLGQAVVLSGEAGIGKSRLVQVLKEHVAEASHTMLECRASSYHQHSALYPVIELWQRVWQFTPGETPAEHVRKLEAALAQSRLPVDQTVALLAALLSLPLPADRATPLALTPQQQRQKTLEALLALLLELAALHPLLLIVEDLHWIDPSTLEWLGLLLDQVPTARLGLLMTTRPDFQGHWSARAYLTQLTLGRLSPPQVRQMIARVAGDKALPAEVVQQIVSKADGVPLFVEELTRTALEADWLQEREDHYALTGPLPPLAIPTTLQDALMARLDRLTEGKAVAQLGAALGRTFASELLRAVAPLDELALWRGLVELVQAEVLYQRGVPPQATYTFKHALLQEAAYQSLLKSTRQQYHQRIAQVLTAHFPETVETQPELLAQHYTEAGLLAQAVEAWQQAGLRADARSAHAEASAHFTRALEVLQIMPESPQHLPRAIELLTALGWSLQAVKGYPASEAERAYTRALALCQQIEATPQRVSVLLGLWACRVVRAEFPLARELGEQLLTIAQDAPDTPVPTLAHMALGFTLFHRGELAAARRHLAQGVALYGGQTPLVATTYVGGVQDPKMLCLSYTARVLWLLGYPDQAVQQSQEALAHAHTLAHPFTLLHALTQGIMIHRWRGEMRQLQERSEAVRTLATEQGITYVAAVRTFYRGLWLLRHGQAQEGTAQMQQGLTAYRGMGARIELPYMLAQLAETYGSLGQSSAGLAILAEALALVETTGERWWEAELYRLQGELLWAQAGTPPSVGEVEACMQKALAIARHQQAKSLELRAAMSLSRLWQRQGKRTEAHALLAPVYGWFTEGFDTADLQEAKALLEELA